MIEFYDDFLSKGEYDELYSLVNGYHFPWYYTSNITHNTAADSNLCYLVHLFYYHNRPLSEFYDSHINMFLEKLKAKTFIRVKANFYPGQKQLTQHEPHIDYHYEHKAAIYCINTCDGYTSFKNGEKINSVANRLITFDGNIEHASTDCTNATARININFNYL